MQLLTLVWLKAIQMKAKNVTLVHLCFKQLARNDLTAVVINDMDILILKYLTNK